MQRRSFISALGAAGVLSPLTVRTALAKAHRGAPAKAAPKRLILLPMVNGAPKGSLWPTSGAWPEISEPLQDFSEHIQFVQGLDMVGVGNHMACRGMFTGVPIDDYVLPKTIEVNSLDQVIAKHLQDSDPTRRRSIHVSACPASHIDFYKSQGRNTFYFTQDEAVDYFANPANAFDSYFPDDDTQDNHVTDMRKRVLAMGERELDQIARRISGAPAKERQVATFRASITNLVRSLDSSSAGCAQSPIESVERIREQIGASEAAAYQQDLYSELIDAQLDIIVRALTCGLTRVATMQWNWIDGDIPVPIAPGSAPPHHDTSHGPAHTFTPIQRWYAQKVAGLLAKLKAEPDPLDPTGTATMLDNTCVVWMAECNPDHGWSDVGLLYAGSWGGALKTGGVTETEGMTNRHFLKTLANIAGVDAGASAHFGDEDIADLRGRR